MRISLFAITLLVLLLTSVTSQAKQQMVRVVEPFIQLYSGPGVGYPVFLDLERGSWLTIQRQQVDWYKVKTDKGVYGWVKYQELLKTVDEQGQPVKLVNITQEDFEARDWELGALWGDVEGSNLFTLYGAFAFNANLSAELAASQIIGSLSTSDLYSLSLVAQPFPEWQLSPYFIMGTGVIKTRTSSILVEERDKQDRTTNVGFGVRAYLTRSFFLRAEYSELIIYTSTNDYEELELWSIGVGSFF